MERKLTPQLALCYRRPMQVRELTCYHSGGTFPICPQCGSVLEREYQNYCDRCGQRLGWQELCQAAVIHR